MSVVGLGTLDLLLRRLNRTRGVVLSRALFFHFFHHSRCCQAAALTWIMTTSGIWSYSKLKVYYLTHICSEVQAIYCPPLMVLDQARKTTKYAKRNAFTRRRTFESSFFLLLWTSKKPRHLNTVSSWEIKCCDYSV